ncbi:GNAT family N-acetyltransferase [Halobacillus sp. H74]|uniref:GNAT family N-acetyltransferase n=1 Tax=Halobacillus sp. H74 TaxID=3457436 RepID=UPI003FCD560B
MNIRRAVSEDASQVAKVHVDVWRTTYENIIPNEYLRQLSYDKRERLWRKNIRELDVYVAQNYHGNIVGFSTGSHNYRNRYNEYDGELSSIYILEAYQERGIGKKLLKAVVSRFKSLNIISMIVLVLEENPAKHFYESFGAKQIDSVQVKGYGGELTELVYGWKDIHSIHI